MLNRVLTSMFGSRNERLLKQLQKQVERINALEPQMQALDDAALRAKTDEFRQRVADGESLDKLLVEAFAVVREAARRTIGLRHYDVQLIGGMVLHSGKIAEMRTGEGKTLVATLPTYLNALSGKGAHVVTVNDYLAKRDAAWMGKVYNFLGMSVGVVYPGMPHRDKKAAYGADITYGTNNEYGFDYLRDNMALNKEDRHQRGLNFAIVDEVDSILIDEARTPLIISGPADESPELYVRVNKIVPQLIRQASEEAEGDYWVDEKSKQVHLSEQGMEHAEELLKANGILAADDDLYSGNNLAVVHHLNAAMRAHAIYQRDVDYIVRDGEVVIVDEFTGRTLSGRRWSDGLHQAIEAKEGVPIQRENQTLASITFQNLFRMYKTLSGMTGTADTEAFEFQSIYGLEVVVIPTNRPMIRNDAADLVFLKKENKWKAIIEDIKECRGKGQPVLVGTTSIETSELLSNLLKQDGIQHEVLNAKQHEREALIVAEAGRPGAVTIATNMAGRGTDIVLGGNPEVEIQQLGEGADAAAAVETIRNEWKVRHEQVLAAGGLHIIGTERHESRRIDNQLRGRSGRQGDPGSSRFYLSLEDNLMRIFAADWVAKAMRLMGMKEDEAIEDRMVSRQIEKAQRKVEAHNFDIRKNLLEFDDVANDQRKVIYEQRNDLLDTESVADTIENIRLDVVTGIVREYVPAESVDEQWNLPALEATLQSDFTLELDLQGLAEKDQDLDADGILRHVLDASDRHFREKEAQIGSEHMRQLERHIMLSVLDTNWKEHLARMDYLRQGIHLRGYAQKQPKQEYKREAFELFAEMLEKVKRDCIQVLARIRIRTDEEVAAMEEEDRRRKEAMASRMNFQHADAGGFGAAEEAQQVATGMSQAQSTGQRGAPLVGQPGAARRTPATRDADKVGRNDPCPCGSGKKFKHCHGQIA